MTQEEILQAIEANPELVKPIAESFTAKGYVVRTTEEDASFLSNHETNIIPQRVESAIGEKMKEKTFEMATGIEKDIFEKTGIKKNENEKYFNYLKRAFDEVKGSGVEADSLKMYQDENNSLKEQIGLKENEYKSQLLGYKKDTVVDAALSNIQFAYPAHLQTEDEKAEYVRVQRNFIKNDLANKLSVKDTENGLAFYEGERIMLDTKTNEFLKPKAIIESMYKAFLAPEKPPVQGMGTGGQGSTSYGKMTADKFTEYATNNSLTVGSKDWLDARKELVAA
jgi:hypothetical protein